VLALETPVAPWLPWLVGVAVGLAGLWIGAQILRFLAVRRVAWWASAAGPLLTWGPAFGLIAASALAARSWSDALFWSDEARWPALLGWSLVLFFGVTSLFGLVRSFLTSHLVTEEIGLKIPALVLDGARIVLWIAMVFVVVAGIWHEGQGLTAFFTISAAGTVIVGLALQETLKNFIAGVAIVSEGMFAIGDWVWVGEEEGEVVEITRRTTKLRTRSADLLVIPNVSITSGKVRNESRPTPVHAEFVYVQAPYDVPPTRVRDALRAAALEVPKVLRDPAPILRVHKFVDSGVEYQVKIFVSDVASVPDIKSDVSAQIWYHFRREGIEIPYPVRELRRTSRVAGGPDGNQSLARLRSVPFFAELPEDLVVALARDAMAEEYGAGEAIVRQGEPGDTCYVVDRGRLAVLVTDGQREQQVAVLGTGALFGEMSLLTGEPRSATVRVLDDARVLSIGSRALQGALQKAPEFAQHLAETATLRREGLLGAKATLDAAARTRVREGSKNLGELIRRFFRLPNGPASGGAS
jgi:small-conductance mechanosensitive channel/CRP-like cAMP-binding protein